MWRQFFGTGLSKTLDDLGSQGEWPTHPELLDWLAAEFMEPTLDGVSHIQWDVRHLHTDNRPEPYLPAGCRDARRRGADPTTGCWRIRTGSASMPRSFATSR
jgi:hypothetical protein